MSRPIHRSPPESARLSAPVDLGTVKPFVALGGATVTNPGPSVLNGDLTGIDLGGLVLTAGAYRFTSSARLTGALVLDAQGDPDAQFVFAVATSLTTASASSVLLVNGASPCNVHWQVGSSATLGSTMAFKGNLMALSSISLDASGCGGSTTAGTPSARTDGTDDALTRTTRAGCADGFTATVRGRLAKRVAFTLDGRRRANVGHAPFRAAIRATPGAHRVRARVTFSDPTRAKMVSLLYQACAAAARNPAIGPSRFTG